MSKLNQIVAVEKGVKSRVYGELTDLNKAAQKPELFNGFSKNYQKKDEDGEDLPAEKKRVQFIVRDVLRAAEASMSALMEITARKDWTNAMATAAVVVDGEPLLTGVPVTYLLFLEKQLVDLRTFAENLPILDEGENWTRDINSGLYKSEEIKTTRTKKVAKPIVLYPATPEHPAQTQLATEDVIAGFWVQVKHSGAMPKPEKQALVERIEKLIRAVKMARESANDRDEITPPPVGAAVFEYLLGKE